jgi:hypothetical protein
MKDVNRRALIITPKPAFFKLLTEIFGEETEPPDLTERDTGHVYLISGEILYHDEGLEWLEENRQAFFEEEFYHWYEVEEKIPQDISWSDFQDYFVFSIQSMVTDAAPNEAFYEDYES